ncbi:MAG TPA: flagellar basal-body MS-ring/collar protein FliF [Bryobacteraceae bacterium]|nr:flagellar basal-body MS-ring/collar protein FliF [Bryobacteraceae bacterium]
MKKLFGSLTVGQRATIVLAAVAVVAGLFAFARWKRESDFRPLYTTLASEDAGAVVQKLKESGVEFRLSENGSTVLVPSAKVAEMRLEMASAGLPKSGRIGFELFDKTNFGATEFVEHINYRRALEGELERTVMSLAEVEQARVHVTFPKESVYLESRQPAKASVVVRLKPGAKLVPQNVVAIEHLVASAVEGLAPEAVAVLDVRGNLLSRQHAAASPDGAESGDHMLEIRQSIEHDLVAKINSTLEPLLGADKFRAGASVECDFTSGEQSEEVFDPNKSVMVSSQKSEDTSTTGGAAGVPGTASNLPRPPQKPATALAGTSRRTESIAYQSSRMVKHTKLPEGTVKRMSLSVLVDQDVRWEGQGSKMRRVLEQPSAEKLKSIRDLVAAATGFSADRGDQLIVESLPFESTLNFEPPPAGQGAPKTTGTAVNLPPWLARLLDNRWMAIGASLGVGLVLMLLRRAIAKMFSRKGKARATTPPALPNTAGAADAQIEAQQAQANIDAELQAQLNAAALKEGTLRTEVMVKRFRDNVGKDASLAAHIVRGWLNESG